MVLLPSLATLCLACTGVQSPWLPSRFLLMLPFACLLVMPPRSFRISSTRWMPSAALGFFGRMYRSRCRPRLLDVNACPQKGQFLSLGAFSSGGSALDSGVSMSASPMMPVLVPVPVSKRSQGPQAQASMRACASVSSAPCICCAHNQDYRMFTRRKQRAEERILQQIVIIQKESQYTTRDAWDDFFVCLARICSP
jgi:hypothetical protein